MIPRHYPFNFNNNCRYENLQHHIIIVLCVHAVVDVFIMNSMLIRYRNSTYV